MKDKSEKITNINVYCSTSKVPQFWHFAGPFTSIKAATKYCKERYLAVKQECPIVKFKICKTITVTIYQIIDL